MRAVGFVHRGAQVFVLWLAGAGLIRAFSPEGAESFIALALFTAVLLAQPLLFRRAGLAPLGALPGKPQRGKPHSTPQDTLEARIERIDQLLPQTPCGQCGFGGCRPYAQSLARGESDINRCPPGGTAGIEKLAALLHRPPLPLDPSCGIEKPRVLAFIVEADCIGCTKCIQACPVDAIVGAPKLMHDVITARCTGCELCVPACPVDCIELRPA